LASNCEKNGDLFQPSLRDHALALLRRAMRAARDEAPDSTKIHHVQEGGFDD
jgi:hypothetical protein